MKVYVVLECYELEGCEVSKAFKSELAAFDYMCFMETDAAVGKYNYKYYDIYGVDIE